MNPVFPYVYFYGVHQFRSMTEARWAAFLDELSIAFKYEPEAFKVDEDLYYLPDFWLPEQQVWIEIKNILLDDRAVEKAIKLFYLTLKPVYVINGFPAVNIFQGPPGEIYVEEVAGFSVHLVDKEQPGKLRKLVFPSTTENLMHIFKFYSIPESPELSEDGIITVWRVRFNIAFRKSTEKQISRISKRELDED